MKLNLQCVMLSRQNSLFDWNRTFRARKFDTCNSRKLFKSGSDRLFSVSCFRKRSHFLTEFKPLRLEPGFSTNARRRKFERISSRNHVKSTSNRLCTAPYFRERSHFLLKPNLQISIFSQSRYIFVNFQLHNTV